MPRPIVLDVDTGTDDALALLYAVGSPDLDLRGVGCVAGNAGLDQVVDNTLRSSTWPGRPEIPVAAGATKPFIERAQTEEQFHGEDGLERRRAAGTDPEPSRRRARRSCSTRRSRRRAEPVTLVSLAPMTNVAMLLTLHPDVADHLERLVFMGGSASQGNVTAVAEFNVWQDPEAATCVVESGLPVTMYGLDVFNRLLIPQEAADRWARSEHPAVRPAGELLHRRGMRAAGVEQDYAGVLGDAGALVILTHPELFTPTAARPGEPPGHRPRPDRRRPSAGSAGPGALDRDPWPVLEVALDLDVDAAAAASSRSSTHSPSAAVLPTQRSLRGREIRGEASVAGGRAPRGRGPRAAP